MLQSAHGDPPFAPFVLTRQTDCKDSVKYQKSGSNGMQAAYLQDLT